MTTDVRTEGAKRRLIEVDRVTGFAILLVVVGHVVAREHPADNEWYVRLKFYIYQFHMPLFMCMSGLVFRYTSTAISTSSDYSSWASKKITRLAPGFLLVGFTIVTGKALFRGVIHVDNVQGNYFVSIFRLIMQPTDSAAASLWYIYVLLEFYLLFPILNMVVRNQRTVILALVIGMHAIHLTVSLPSQLAVDSVFEFALYFWLGALCCDNYDRLLAVVARYRVAFVLLFAVSFAATEVLSSTPSKTLIGLASIPAVVAVIGTNTGRPGRLVTYVSAYTFVIYLLNTLAIGITKGVMLKVLPWDGRNFYLYFVILASVGLLAPILAQRWVFSRNKTLSRIMN